MSPGRADEPVVRRHLVALHAALVNLRRHAGATSHALRADADLRWTVERGLHLCAQNALDIATHIASAAGRDAAGYTSAIDILVEVEVLPSGFGARFREVAGFRNILVHGYLEVDLEVVVRVLREHLGDFERFAAHIETWLSE